MKILLILTSILLSPIQELSEYSPLSPGSAWVYKMSDSSFESYVDQQKFTYKNVDYLQSITKYSDGTAEINYYRIEKNGAVYYLDNKSFKESIEIPAKPRLSLRWNSSDDKWKYTIVEMNAELKTPVNTFKNCIAIKAESTSYKGDIYINYYSKGVGFVGSKMDNKLITYLIKWKLNEKKS